MVTNTPISTTTPLFSVIIGVYNDWTSLDHCLASLAEQTNEQSFEVIVVDDGSRVVAPEFIHHWNRYYPLIVVRQTHTGVACARNRGVQLSSGSILLFADADCRFQRDCIEVLASTVADSPQ